MKYRLALFLFSLGFICNLPAQDAAPATRYGEKQNLQFFPQKTAKDTLRSVMKAAEKQDFVYVAAQLVDPAFMDARVEDRAKLLLDSVEREFRSIRDVQRRNARVPTREQLPLDPAAFAEAIRAEAKKRAFGFVVQDIRKLWTENPEYVRLFQKYLREATFTDAGETSTAILPGAKGEQINFVVIEGRYYMLDSKTQPVKK